MDEKMVVKKVVRMEQLTVAKTAVVMAALRVA
jgi:hypothetical protein